MSTGQYTIPTQTRHMSDLEDSRPAAGAVVRVSIVDAQPLTRTGLERVVSLDPRLTLVASVPEVDDPALSTADWDVIVLALSPQDSATALDVIANAATIGRPVVMSTWDRSPTPLSALRAGARGCVTRYSPQSGVVDALRVVARGGFYLCAQLVGQLHTELRRPRSDDLSGLAPREIETLRWIALGFTQEQIASRMGLSPATVNTYAKRIRGKLNVGNKAELTRVAIALGYLSDDPCHHTA